MTQARIYLLFFIASHFWVHVLLHLSDPASSRNSVQGTDAAANMQCYAVALDTLQANQQFQTGNTMARIPQIFLWFKMHALSLT
eukprot:1146063-Pelagomonas_calceolata.AAC.11